MSESDLVVFKLSEGAYRWLVKKDVNLDWIMAGYFITEDVYYHLDQAKDLLVSSCQRMIKDFVNK